jgi:hypothetical protein
MRTGVLAFISKMSSKFLRELLPVALASVVGGHLRQQHQSPASHSVVVQASAPPDAVLQN